MSKSRLVLPSTLTTYWRGREDAFVEQRKETHSWVDEHGKTHTREPGSYFPRKWIFGEKDASIHLSGERTYGRYQINKDDKVHWLCADIEHDSEVELEIGLEFLERFGVRTVTEQSSRGRYHLWILMSSPLEAEYAYEFGLYYKENLYRLKRPGIIAAFPDKKEQLAELQLLSNREFFPKQPTRGSGWGNLVRFPCGTHQKKGDWSELLHHGQELPTVGPARIKGALMILRSELKDPASAMREIDPERVVTDRKIRSVSNDRKKGDWKARYEAINNAISIGQVVAEILRIPVPKPGEVVKCPFHDKGTNGSSGQDSFMVGGRVAADVAWCWSPNCPTQGKRFSRVNFVREYEGIEDIETGIQLVEQMAGLR